MTFDEILEHPAMKEIMGKADQWHDEKILGRVQSLNTPEEIYVLVQSAFMAGWYECREAERKRKA